MNNTATLGAALRRIHPSHVALDRAWSTLIFPPNKSSGYAPTIVASRTYTFAVFTFSWNTRNGCRNAETPAQTLVGCRATSPSPRVRTATLLCCPRPRPRPPPRPAASRDDARGSTSATLGNIPAQITARTNGSSPAFAEASLSASAFSARLERGASGGAAR